MSFQVGDTVVLTQLPPWVVKLPLESRRVYEYCLGRPYQVVDIDENCLLLLDIAADVNGKFGNVMKDIRVEPEYVCPAGE